MSGFTLERVAAALEKRGFAARVVASRDEARAIVLKVAESAQVIGIGGTESVKALGVPEALAQAGKTLIRETPCDLFLLSANALTADGRTVNVDGNGNRVAASIHGAGHVL